MTAVLIPEQEIPDSGAFSLTMQIADEVKISASEARKSVNRHLSYLFQADKPHLIVLDSMVCWQLPIVLTYPSYVGVDQSGTSREDRLFGASIVACHA